MSAARLEASGLSVSLGDRVLVRELSFALRAGECCVVVGPNGAGKSTLLRTLAGLRVPAAGDVRYDGEDVARLTARERALRRGWVPEATPDPFAATVLETVLVGRHPALGRWEWESDRDRALAREALASVGLDALADRDVVTLSGGERRRVAIATVLAQDPGIMLLDEPSAHLDPGQQVTMLDLLRDVARTRSKALVLVLHDLHLALRYADRAIAVAHGDARAGTASDILRADVLSRVFDHELVEVGSGRARTLLPV